MINTECSPAMIAKSTLEVYRSVLGQSAARIVACA